MVGIFAIVGPLLGAVAKLGEYVVSPLKDKCSYLCYYHENTRELRGQVEKLEITRARVQLAVDAAKRNIEVVGPDVEDWLKQGEEIKAKTNRMYEAASEVRKGCVHGWCPNLKLRYSLSRDAKKMAKIAIDLQLEAKFEKISYPMPPKKMKTIPTASIEFESQKSVEQETMEALKDDKVYVIGVCGMGGVGKTMMARKIGQRATEEKLFEEVVLAVVSQQPDLRKVQQQIAEGLGLKLEEDSFSIRARKLHTRLMDIKSFLIILDDVWAWMNLEDLGIPSRKSHETCKIIITSRDRDVLAMAGAAKILSMEVLSEEEAWILFGEKAGDCGVAPHLHELAIDVAKECKGLPLALVTVGSALRNKSKPYWEDALLQLQRSVPTNIPTVLRDVYRPLELSYNQLGSDEAKHLFLLCCLFPEDYGISLDDLVEYGMGLGIFTAVENLAEARNRVHGLVEILKNCFLLGDGRVYEIDCVRMHDVIRDMAISVASRNKNAFMVSHNINLKHWPNEDSSEKYTCISIMSNNVITIPQRVNCPRLEGLRLEFRGHSQNLPGNFFDEMRGLKVSQLEGVLSLPMSIQFLRNLQKLNLCNCFLETISVLGELVNLKILRLCFSSVQVLPREIGRLQNLKLLDLRSCYYLEKIASGALSGLVKLEELLISDNSRIWEDEEGEERSNRLVEVASLKHLTTLEISISDPNLIPEGSQNWQQLARYAITISNTTDDAISTRYVMSGRSFEKSMTLYLPEMIPLGETIDAVLRNAEYLNLRGDGMYNIVKKLARWGFQSLKVLWLSRCDRVEYLMDAFHHKPYTGIAFPVLESLHLSNCENLKEIFRGTPPVGSFAALRELEVEFLSELKHFWKSPVDQVFFSSLRSLSINSCKSLRNALPISVAGSLSLSQLKQLSISNCDVMEHVFPEETGVYGNPLINIALPKLIWLELNNLPNFNCFGKMIHGIEFPQLQTLEVNNLPMFKSFCSTECGFFGEDESSFGQQFLFSEKVNFPPLKVLSLERLNSIPSGVFSLETSIGSFNHLEILHVESCHSLRTLFPPHLVRGLINLKKLQIKNCLILEEVIAEEDKDGQINARETLLPQLKELVLSELPKICRFCHMHNDLEFPSLETITIHHCPRMKTFSLGSLCIPRTTLVLGMSTATSISQFFFNEQKNLVDYSKDDFFMLFVQDLSIRWARGRQHCSRYLINVSSDDFVIIAELLRDCWHEISGRFEAVKLSPGTLYEVLFVVKVKEPTNEWAAPLDVKIILPSGHTQVRVERLTEKPRGQWIEISAGEFRALSSYKFGFIEFSLCQDVNNTKIGIFFKCVTIRPKKDQGTNRPPYRVGLRRFNL